MRMGDKKLNLIQSYGQKPNPLANGLDEVRATLRTAHYSKSTEEIYTSWIRLFILHINKTHPKEMGKILKLFIIILIREEKI